MFSTFIFIFLNITSHRINTDSWKWAGKVAANGAANGFMAGSISGAITGGIGRAAKVVKAAKSWSPGTGKSGYSSLKYHYNKHVVKEGFSKGNNVVKYTKDAVNFSKSNKSMFKYTYNYKYQNSTWYHNYSYGSGGYYTSSAKIISYWYR